MQSTIEEKKMQVGEGMTEICYSDRRAYTIVAISPSGKTMKLKRDKATLTNAEEKQFYPGGFCGHTVFPNGQKYSYEHAVGEERKVRLTVRGWMNKGTRFVPGRAEHYDYNF